MFIVMAHRDGSGRCEAASRPVQENGTPLTFPTLDAAREHANGLNWRTQDTFARAGKPCPISYSAAEA